MDAALVDQFVHDGFLHFEQAVPADVTEACARLLWEQIDAEPDDPSTWKQPVHWVGNLAQLPFATAMNVPVLVDAMDTLVGPGRWQPRNEMGAFPLRFPHSEEPDDAGWHIEGAYMPPGESSYWTNVHSSYRALLLLFLFTDVDEDTAPTRIRVGSHLDVPRVLLPYGEKGASGAVLGPQVDAASAHRTTVRATGRAGDVFVCHPFLVHAAQPNHGARPRFLSQPCISPTDEHLLRPYEGNDGPVARTIRQALRDT